MCFSASASFSASALLLIIGILCLYKKRGSHQIMLAFIPILFSLQQAFEGFVWLAKTDILPEWTALPFGYGFLVFAFLLWSLWIPISIKKYEKNYTYLYNILIACGACASFTLLIALLYYPLFISIQDHHIVYYLDIPYTLSIAIGINYVTATCLSFFFAKNFIFKIAGLLILISCFLCLYYQAFVSLWCFFAAIISMLLVILFFQQSRMRS